MGEVPGGNPIARLAGLMGRRRGLEVILGANDFSADLAERYGYINRAVPDEEIVAFIDSLAERLASFEKHALVGAKALMNDVTLPPDEVFQHSLSAFLASTVHPVTRACGASWIKRGLQLRSDTEMRPSDCGARGGMIPMT
jgi:enoyl-CoA hydratase/carnithine racemase